MAAAEIFDSAVRPAGDLAGAFEFDGTTGYFYLCNVIENGNPTVLDHIHLYSGDAGLAAADIVVRWDFSDTRVGLFVRGVMWAVFNCLTGQKHGGAYVPGGTPRIPVEEVFDVRVH